VLLNPIKLVYDLYSTASYFNQLGKYTSSPGRSDYCYAETAVFFRSGGVTIAITHCAYPRRDGQAELARYF